MLSVPWDSAYEFQPTLPLRGETAERRADSSGKEFQPTLPLRGATQ